MTEDSTPYTLPLPEAELGLAPVSAPVIGRIVSNDSCLKGKSASFVRHTEIDISGTPLEGRCLVGQAFGILAPGLDERGKPHKVRLYSIACPSDGEDGAGKVISTTTKRTIDERTPQKKNDDPDDHSLFLGVCSNYICNLGPGDEVKVTGPNGKRFLLPDSPNNHDYLFVATGTGIAPIVAEEAKRSGALVVAVVTTPFTVERRKRMQLALEGLDLVRKAADAVLVLDNNRLLHFVPNLPLDEAFSIMDQLIAEIVKGVVETITLPSLINLDFADVRSIMKGGGVTMMLYGESDQGPEEVVHESLNHPLLDIEIDGATGALIHVTGGPYMTLEQANQVCDLMTARLSPNANVIFGARQDPAFGDTIKVMSIITGVAHERLDREMMSADMLGDALNIAKKGRERADSGFQRFD